VFGKSNFYNFTSYVGELLDDDKYHSLIQFKYHISCENNFEYNYATEKIWEPILCECLCFYHGCPNLEDYIDSNAFVRIDLNDFESSLQIVKKAMQEDWWSQRLPFIRAEKQKILTKLGFFPALENIIESKSKQDSNLNIRLQEFRNSNMNNNSNKNKKKIAICLFGQPRDYVIGHKNIKDLIENQQQYDCDVFFHCWNIENHSVYKSAEWREIPKKSLLIEDMDVVNQQLLDLYKPVKYKFENSIDKFNENIYNDTIAYNNITNDKILQNINNILSQMYSRNEVRKLFEQHVSEKNIEYDYVIITRFDVMKKINLKLELLEGNKVYIDNMHYPRKIITDTFIICPQHIFILWFNLFDNLKNILNNEEINKKMKQNNEKLIVNAEELIMANFIYYFDINLVNYLPNINVYKQ
jgi:hypothetical protein